LGSTPQLVIGLHARSACEAGGVLWYCPGTHADSAWHTRSLVRVGATVSNSWGWQTLRKEQARVAVAVCGALSKASQEQL
jgi:hypothetical protein